MSFFTDVQLRASIAGSIHKRPSELDDSSWESLVTSSNGEAYRRIVSHFLKLGYTKAVIDTWDRGADFQEHLAIFNALIRSQPNSQQVGEWRRELDFWRTELSEIELLEVSGVTVDPASAGLVGRGDLSTSYDRFVLDSDDPRIGQVTEW